MRACSLGYMSAQAPSMAMPKVSQSSRPSGSEREAPGRLATARTTSPSGAVIDLLFASSGIEPEIVSAAEHIEILDGFKVPVATIPHLIAMKVLARDDRTRPQDRLDLAGLFRKATEADLDGAREALELIDRRGCARGRRLLDDLEKALGELKI